MPAIVLAWIARHRDRSAAGRELMGFALGRARIVARAVGAVALVLDPKDEEVGRLWRAPPYNFRSSSQERRRLWMPLSPAA
jgi:hypothetical protein